MEELYIGGLKVLLRRSERRRTVGLSVLRDGSVAAIAPADAPLNKVEGAIRQRELWLQRALAQREATSARGPGKEYVSGEGFHYLGRKYRLKVRFASAGVADVRGLRFFNGQFHLDATAAREGRKHFVRWYCERAREWLREHLPALQARVGAEPAKVAVMDLGFRWGSCSTAGRINFHWRIVLLPPDIIRYLVLHELCHLMEHSHDKAFWKLVARVDHEYERKERWLAQNGARYMV